MAGEMDSIEPSKLLIGDRYPGWLPKKERENLREGKKSEIQYRTN